MKRARLVTPTFLIVMLSTFGYFVTVGALQPTLPRFVEGPLGGSDTSVGIAIGIFAVSAIVLRPLAGRLADSKGRGLLVILGAALVGISVLGYVIADSLWLLLVLRLLTGAGEAFFYVGAASTINDLSPDERRGEAFSYFSLALFGGLAVGPVLGEWILGTGFNAVWVFAAATAFAAAVAGIALPDTRPAVVQGEERFTKLVHPAALLPGIVLACLIWGLAGWTTFVPLYADQLGMDGSKLVYAEYSVIILAFRSLGARIPDRLGAARAARSSLSLAAVGFGLIALWAEPAVFTWARRSSQWGRRWASPR